MEKNICTVKSVGTVHAGSGSFSIEIEEGYRAALNGLEDFSHIMVIYWGHLAAGDEYRSILECEKPYVHGPDRLGIFATRSPMRPNPIEISTVVLAGVDPAAGIIRVPWIDAEDGSPVLDIKPYHPSGDRVRLARVPAWCSHWPEWLEDSADFNWDAEFTFGG